MTIPEAGLTLAEMGVDVHALTAEEAGLRTCCPQAENVHPVVGRWGGD